MMRRNTTMKSLIKTGFGLSIGVFLAQMIFVFIGILLFVPGYILYTKSSEKDKSGSRIGGVVLMGLGVVIMGGIGFGLFLDSAGDLFE